jgi:hypothetical protein
VAKRSPILGYNHNVRHRGLLFHVQTEDSGVDNPHIYTHLFHGGIIVSSRKLQYDRESAEDVVKSLMQAQHKASLRELKAGALDQKITSYLGDHPDLEPAGIRSRPGRDTIDSIPAPSDFAEHEPPDVPDLPPPLPRMGSASDGHMPEPSQTGRSGDVSNAFRLIKRETTSPGTEPTPPPLDLLPHAARRRSGNQTGYSHHRTGQLERMPEVQEPPPTPAPRGKGRNSNVVSPIAPRPPAGGPRPAGKPHAPAAPPLRPAGKPRPPSSPPSLSRPSGQPPRAGVVVSRPSVIVGAPPRVISPREPAGDPAAPRVRRAREDTRPSLFGKDLISERSLDEVILAYLSEDASEK